MSTKSIFATGVDAGSAYTRCVIALLEDRRLRLVGYGSVPSEGWAKSRISDQQAVSECVLAAVEEAEAMAQTAIETVVTGMGGLTARGANSRGRMDFGRPREIEQRDINRAVDRAMHIQLQDDRMVLQLLPQDFVVDDHPGFHDPRKMMASVIESNVHLITISTQEHNNLIGAINRAHLSVDETVYEPIACCYASVLPSDRREGVALIDIGAHSTELVCYYGESAQVAASLRVSGDHFSRDVAHALRIPVEAAAMVKHEFGGAVSQGTAGNCMVEVPLAESYLREGGHDAREAPRKFINQILESRTVELFELVRAELERAGMQRAIASGLVIAGGGALLPGICDVAEKVLECPARIGLAQGFQDWPDELNDPAWTTTAGLSMYAARLRSQVDLERQSVGMLGRILR
ncbi:MAG TPA: cell division protein FtsA [Bryobacteraceae bacterium]|jgi:cell division protein FtsA|nr:cell division protein FtsA [Bryobacteraceae bacterium]